MTWEIVIGLEVHVQLSTQSKLFSAASTAFGAPPNTQASLIDLGFPGVLPVVNEQAIAKAVAFGLAIEAQIGYRSQFDRKNYFYPDLPKGYQITQLAQPIVQAGATWIQLDSGQSKRIGITRAHLEEDAGKSLHDAAQGLSGIDLNRAGTPLLEIVSEPELRSAEEAVAYLKKIHALVTCLDICDGNMAQGSLRCDVNISVRPQGQLELGTRTEIKNVNSFRFVEKAIHYEAQRQIDVLEEGGTLVQETRLYDADRDETRSLRTKEFANDYRYFPDPDLLLVLIDDAYVQAIARSLPELPDAKIARFEREYALSAYDATVLAASKALAQYFEQVVQHCQAPKLAANWVSVELLGRLNKAGLEIDDCPIDAPRLGALIERIQDNTLSSKIAKTVFEALWSQPDSVDAIIERKGLRQVSDQQAIQQWVAQVIEQYPQQVSDYRQGKTQLLGFFVGQIMKLSKGQANPALVNRCLQQQLALPQ